MSRSLLSRAARIARVSSSTEEPATLGPRRVAVEPLEKPIHSGLGEELRREQRPRLLRGVASAWPASSRWSLEYFESQYGSTAVRTAIDLPERGIPYLHFADDHYRQMTVAEFIALLRSPERTKPCYLEMETVDHFAGLEADLGFDAFAPPEPGYQPRQKLWLGSAGTRSGLHFDDGDNFLVQIHGRKKAYIIAPDDPKVVHPFRWNVAMSPFDPDDLDLERFPNFASATVHEVVIEPGDALFIPAYWWHFVQALEPSMSVNSWYTPSRLDMHAKILYQCGLSHWVEFGRQFFVCGVLNRPHRNRLFATDPPGKLLYRLVADRMRGIEH